MIHVERMPGGFSHGPYIREMCHFWTVVTCDKRYVLQPGDKDRHGRVLPYASVLRVQCDVCWKWHDSELQTFTWCYPDFSPGSEAVPHQVAPAVVDPAVEQ